MDSRDFRNFMGCLTPKPPHSQGSSLFGESTRLGSKLRDTESKHNATGMQHQCNTNAADATVHNSSSRAFPVNMGPGWMPPPGGQSLTPPNFCRLQLKCLSLATPDRDPCAW